VLQVWVQQIGDFIQQVVGSDQGVIVCGNSLGGYAALATAASYPGLITGLALLNAAGERRGPGPRAQLRRSNRQSTPSPRRAIKL
jgi:pimeloyl-ACP methyl ester carboxylesterase